MRTNRDRVNARLRKWMEDGEKQKNFSPMPKKKPEPKRNSSEGEFESLLDEWGWYVTKRGYPDFICYRPDGEMVLVEVKKTPFHKLTEDQERFMSFLARRRVPPMLATWVPGQRYLREYDPDADNSLLGEVDESN